MMEQNGVTILPPPQRNLDNLQLMRRSLGMINEIVVKVKKVDYVVYSTSYMRVHRKSMFPGIGEGDEYDKFGREANSGPTPSLNPPHTYYPRYLATCCDC